jgi:chromosome segregation ATPase
MTIRVDMTEAGGSRPGGLDQGVASKSEGLAIDWRDLAERRLSRLAEVEHDVAIARDRLDYFQSSYRALLRQSEERLLRVRELERELAQMRTARARLRGALGKWLSEFPRRLKAMILLIVRMFLRIPLVRPVGRRVMRLFPGLSKRLRASLAASRQPE